MKKLIQLRGSSVGTHSYKTYTLVSIDAIIYVFIVDSYDNSLKLESIKEGDYHIKGNITKEVIKNPNQFEYYHYEDFVGIWRASIIQDSMFMPDAYYIHLIQFNTQRINQVKNMKSGVKRKLNLLAEHLDGEDYDYKNQIHLG